MHVVFMPYGIKNAVDHLLADMQAEKFPMHYKDEKGIKRVIHVQGSLRILPFGFYEYIFPETAMDLVLTTLDFQTKVYPMYKHLSSIFAIMRKFLKTEKIPKFKTERKLLWIRDFVSILPLGIRRDQLNWKDPRGNTHERL